MKSNSKLPGKLSQLTDQAIRPYERAQVSQHLLRRTRDKQANAPLMQTQPLIKIKPLRRIQNIGLIFGPLEQGVKAVQS